MSIQIRGYEHECLNCDKIFIPLYENYPCPSCQKINVFEPIKYDEYNIKVGFIKELVDLMKYCKLEYGQFIPPSAYFSGMTGNVQRLLYQLFDKIEADKIEYYPGVFDEEIKKYFGKEREYFLQNFKDIFGEVYKKYQSENFFIVEEQKFSIMEKIKRGWRDFKNSLIP